MSKYKLTQSFIRENKAKLGYHTGGTPKSNNEMDEDELENFYLNSDTIDENWEPEKFTIMGDVSYSKYQGKTNNLDDLFNAIDKLPDTIKSIKVPINTNNIQPTNVDFKIFTPQAGYKEEIKSIITQLVDEYESEGENITSFVISSFDGGFNEDKASYYITLTTKRSNDFSDNMSKGKFGSLDEEYKLRKHFQRFL